MAAGSSCSKSTIVIGILLVTVAVLTVGASAQLSSDYYKKTCPKVFDAVKSVVKSAVLKERRMGASLLRLHFHDCFVQGCDGSVLLDDTSSWRGEKSANPNINSLRGFNVVDDIKSKVESVCPGVVSCADILAISARDSVALLGGPTWEVKLGRKDSKSASLSAANSGVIPPPTSSLSNLINRFQNLGLSTKDMVVLSGAHSIGQARCTTFRGRIYNESNIDASFARQRQGSCPSRSGSGDNNLAPLDKSPTLFDNAYYKHLVENKGLLHSDQVLFNGASTDNLVNRYSNNPDAFARDFAAAMIRMGAITPLTGSNGQVRKICTTPNSK